MSHHHLSVMLLALVPTMLLIRDGDPQEKQKKGPASKQTSEPVLRDQDDAKTIIAKAVKAHGGEKSFARWNCGYLKYKTKGGVISAQAGDAIVEDTFQLPGHFKRVAHIDARETKYVPSRKFDLIFVINDGKGWTKKGDAPAEPMENDFTERTEHPFAAFCNLTLLTAPKVNMTKLGTEKINGNDAIGMRAKSEILNDVDFYFASKTGLLLKTRKSLPASDALRKLLGGADTDKASVLETYLSDYKEVQGTQIPMRIYGTQDGQAILDVVLLEARFADKCEEGTFAKP
jgi:hypothetical protein